MFDRKIKKKGMRSLILLAIFALFVTGCADAGKDQSVYAQEQVMLDGSQSKADFGGQIVKYRWKQVRGTAVTLTGKQTATPSFIAPEVEVETVLVFRLMTLERGGYPSPWKSQDRVRITIKPSTTTNQAPQAIAEANASSIKYGQSIYFSGSNSSDSDGEIVSYSWRDENGLELSTASNFTHTFETTGTHTLTLTVTDDGGLSSSATVRVEVAELQAPQANIAVNTTSTDVGTTLHFDANASSDADGQIVSYVWLDESNTTLSSQSTLDYTFDEAGEHTFTLLVTDDDALEGRATVSISVKALLLSLELSSTTLSLDVNESASVVATAHYNDNSSKDVSALVQWFVANPDILSIDSNGTLKALQSGTTQITASLENRTSNPLSITVNTPVTLQSLSITPNPVEVRVGKSLDMQTLATYSDGSSALVDVAEYLVDDTSIISIDPTGTLDALKVGSTSFRVKVGSRYSGLVFVTVGEELNTTNFNFTNFGSTYTELIPVNATKTQYDEKRFCMIAGQIKAEDGSPLSGVKVSIHAHPEYGSTLTDSNGSYTLPAEGGLSLTMRYTKQGYTTIDRKVLAPVQDWVRTPDVTMLALDTKVTTIDLKSPTPQMHVSTKVTDERGTRSTTLVFDGVSRATVFAPDGSARILENIDVRATEFKTPDSMPSDLPTESAFTYCSDLSIDGVNDDENVTFDAPVVMYVENFLGFEVGEIVPVGYYDRNAGAWKASDNGVVVKLLDTDGDGVVDALDSTGDDAPNDLDGDGSFTDEVAGLADNPEYVAGKSYWRAEMMHFTPWDHNWPYGPPDDATDPNEPDASSDDSDTPNDCQKSVSSYVTTKTRTFHEDIPLAGTDITLHYSSKRAGAGSTGSAYTYVIDASLDTTNAPSSVVSAYVTCAIAGRVFSKSVTLNELNTLTFEWDGLDAASRAVAGEVEATITAHYKYGMVYFSATSAWSQAWARAGGSSTNIIGRSHIEYKKSKTITLNVQSVENSNAKLGNGWTLSTHDRALANSILKGSGGSVSKTLNAGIITTVAGTGAYGFSGDGGLASEASLAYPWGVSVDAVGNLYIADYGNHRIRKVDTSGIITTVAGTGAGGFSGDGGLASKARLYYPYGVSVDAVGNLYIADTSNNRIRKVDTSGIITTVAGTGAYGFSGDGGLASEARLFNPWGVSVDAVGNLYIADTSNNRIRKVSPSALFQSYGLGLGDTIYRHPDNTADIFDVRGKHLKRVDLHTGKALKTFSYDENNHLIAISDRFGQTTTITRDAEGNPTAITAPNGQVTRLSIDENGDLVEVRYEDNTAYTFSYFAGSLMDTMTDPNGNLIYHNWDAHGRIVEEIDGLGGSYRFLKNINATETFYSMVLPEGERSTSRDIKLPNGDTQSTMTLPTGETYTATFAKDESRTEMLRDGVRTVNAYTTDTLTHQRLLASREVTQPSGLKSTTAYTTTYDGNETHTNSKTQTITANGKTATTLTDYNTGTITLTTPEGRSATSTYDVNTLLTTQSSSGTLTPTTYTYDAKGRVTTETTGSRVTTYTYDARGNLATLTNPRGETTSYEYDTVDRLTKVTYANGTTEHFSYDSNGNLLSRTVPTPAEHTFGYNGGDLKANYTSPLNKATTYSYDKSKNLTSITKPSGKTIVNNYTNGRLSSTVTPEGTTEYSYLFANKVGSITKDTESFTYSYDGTLLTKAIQAGILNHTTEYSYNNDFALTSTTYAGATQTYSYDNDGLLISSGDYTLTRDAQNGYVTALTDGTLNQNRSYNSYGELTELSDNTFGYQLTQRDNAGAITQKVETLGGTSTTYDYSYDTMGRLTEVQKDNTVVETYTYDANGNRESATVNNQTISASYTLDDSLVVYGDNTYSYDDDGYLKTKTTPDGATTYSYGTLGELQQVTTPTKTISYKHNANNQRVAKLVDGTVVEKYLWENLTTLLAIYDANDNLIQRFEYADQRMPVAMTMGATKYYLHYDQVGSLRAVSDANGNVVKEITYDTFGNILSDSNPTFKVPFGFAGGLYDADTKLTRFGYRDYDAYTGKWTAKDPIGFAGGDSNLYGYVWSDPVNWVDENGLSGKRGITGGGFGGGIKPITYPWSNTNNWNWADELLLDLERWWDDVCYAAEHTKKKRPSTKGTHQKGQSRKKQDAGGEKGDKRRSYPRKRPNNWKGKWPPIN